MDAIATQLAALLVGSRQLGAVLPDSTNDPVRRARLLAERLRTLSRAPLAACLIKTSDGPALGIVPDHGAPWAEPVAQALEGWARSDTDLPEVSLAAMPAPHVLCGERIRFAGTDRGLLALAVEPQERDAARALLSWAADLLALHWRVEECEQEHATDGQPAGRVALGELTGLVTHQFNNILNDIVLQLAVLERRNLSAEAHAEAVAIRQRSQLAAGLVKELQRYSRSFQTAPTAVDLNAVVHHTVACLSASAGEKSGAVLWSLPGGKRLTLRLEQAPGLPAILGSAGDVARLLGLLLHSSAAALEGKGETIHIRTQPGETGPQLLVEDSGPGVTADMLPRLFEPFVVTRHGSDGLALAVCRGLTRRMQASLRGENRAAGGMAFVVGFVPAKK
jgi:signal transduction histidine kinase